MEMLRMNIAPTPDAKAMKKIDIAAIEAARRG